MTAVQTRPDGLTTMKAIVQDRYGAPEDVLTLQLTDRPRVRNGDVLVRVHAAAVPGDDWHLMRGLPYVARFATGLRKPKHRIPGLQMSGIVAAVGSEVGTFQPGDAVFGWAQGSFAEYVSVPAEQLTTVPANLTLDQAATVPISAFTALQAVRDRGRVAAGHHVLITGAAGGVGGFAIQIAKAYGAQVTAVCSAAKTDYVLSLGADHVIDYTQQALTDADTRYDVLLDIYGNPSLATCKRVLKPGGTLVLIGGTGGKWFMGVDRWLRGLLLAPLLRLTVRPLVHKDSAADLLLLREMLQAGTITTAVDRAFPLSQLADAIRHVTAGHARGSVIVTLPASEPAGI